MNNPFFFFLFNFSSFFISKSDIIFPRDTTTQALLFTTKATIMPVLSVNSRNADGTPVLKEGEQVLATQPHVSLYFNPEVSEGSGVVYVTSMYVFVAYIFCIFCSYTFIHFPLVIISSSYSIFYAYYYHPFMRVVMRVIFLSFSVILKLFHIYTKLIIKPKLSQNQY